MSKTIIFLPGSRSGEIDRHSPIMSQAIKYLKSKFKIKYFNSNRAKTIKSNESLFS